MRKINFWLWNLTISLLMIGATTTAAKAQTPYTCSNYPHSVSYSGTTLSFYTNNWVLNNYSGYTDNYYYQITDQSVTSVDVTDMTAWSTFGVPSGTYNSTEFGVPNYSITVPNVGLCMGSYKLWIVNKACSVPEQIAYSTTFNVTTSGTVTIGVVDLNDGKINILSNSTFDFQSQPYQYCVYEASETPTTWTTVNSFYADKIANVSKDQNGNALVINTDYRVAVRALNASCTQGLSNTFQINTCAEQVTNMQVTDLENGKVNVSWTGTATAPADGYAWAIAQVGFTPSYPSDYRFTTQTSLTNVDTTYNGNALAQGTDYVVYVISACDTLTSYSNRAESDIFNIVTCTSVPSNLVVTQTGTNQISFSWSAASPVPADGYKYAVVNSGSTPTISNYTDSTSLSVSNVGTTFNSINLVHNNTYEVYVLGSCGVNSYSTPITAEITINNCTGAPTQVNLTQAGNGTFSLGWTAPTSVPADGYAYAIAKVGTTPSFPADYTAEATTSVTDIATTFNGAPLQSGVEYVAYLVSVCETATNTASIVVTDTTEFSTCQATVSNLVVTQNDGALTITFNASTPAPADGYVYAVTPINTTVTSAHYVNVASSPIANITNTTNDGSVLAHNAEYVVNVKAACDLSLNYVSAAITDTVKINNCAATPTNLVINTTTNDFTISWTEPTPAPADGYSIYVGQNANALANYPSGFYTGIDTNVVTGTNWSTDAYYVFVVSACGTSHSDALEGNFSLINCDDTPATITKVETGVNGVNATWESNGAALPADGFAYAVVRSGYSSPSNINQQATFVQNNLSVSNVTETFDGLPLVDGQNYYFYVYNVCDSTKGYYGYTSYYFTYRECHAPSNVNLWVNADNTLSATWEKNTQSTTVAHYLYAIHNGAAPSPLLPLNYTATNATNVSNVATTYDNQAFVAGNDYYISVYAVCDATKNIVSYDNGDYVYFDGAQCNVNGYINTTYTNNALSIKYNLYNGSAVPAQGYRYAVIPDGASVNAYNYSKVFTANSSTQTMTGITQNTLDNGALITNQSYNVYFYAVCDSVNEIYNTYNTSFTANNQTVYCDEVYDLKLIDNNNKSITIEWDYDGIPTNGYEYAVLPIGTQLQATNFVATASSPVYNVFTTSTGDSLVHNTAYAVYVRAKCDATNYSDVVSKSIMVHSTLAISDIDGDAVKVYPNPVSSTLTIELPTVMAGNSTVTITDISGKLISVTAIDNVVSELNMSELVNGFYLLTIDSEVLQKTIRIVKQ